MEKYQIDNLTIFYEAEDSQYLPLFSEAYRKSAPIVRNFTGLPDPDRCRVYILRSWRKFMFHAVSIPEKIIYAVLYPLWQGRVRKQWPLIGGWAMHNKNAFGVKSPPLYATADKSLGEKISIADSNLERKVQGAVCHELIHVYCSKLKLPVWLNEGIAILGNDLFVGWQTVKPETISFMQQYPQKEKMLTYKTLMSKTLDDTAYQYIRGYWIVRYLMQSQPGKLKALLQAKRSETEILTMLADWFNIPEPTFWKNIDDLLVNVFPDGKSTPEYPASILNER
jgi:hypothetical protein